MLLLRPSFAAYVVACIALAWAKPSAPSSPSGAVTPESFAKDHFDFIVVGGGTAGLVIASRLTENPSVRVGVIEAGKYLPDDMNINLPGGAGYLGNPKYDWVFKSTPQSRVNGRQIDIARGKMVGGSSAINALIWQRASKAEYDLYATAFKNGPQWSFDALLPYFMKAESWSSPPIVFEDQHYSPSLRAVHGTRGPVDICYENYLTDIDIPVVATASKLGIFTNSNPDGGNATGFPLMARTVDSVKGIRSYAANAYYAPVSQRRNLVLLTDAQVTKVNFRQKNPRNSRVTATGVEFVSGGKTYSVGAKKEVVLAAGSIQTPQILELSGIGDKNILSKFGIKTILDIPEVGENLQDHPVALSDFLAKPTTLTLDRLRFNSTFLQQQTEQYNRTKTGALTYTANVLGPSPLQWFVPPQDLSRMIKQLDSSLANLTLTPMQRVQYASHRKLLAEGRVAFAEFVVLPVGGPASVPAQNSSYVTAVTVNLHEFSRGSVHIASSDPLAPPAIDPRFLEIPFDAEVLLQGTKFIRKWMATEPISKYLIGPNSPSPEVQTDADFDSYVRNILQTTNHPLGTTAMAPREMGGVVDNRMRVYNTENLRIIDAGVIPLSLGVAILSTVYAFAEKAADMIKQDFGV